MKIGHEPDSRGKRKRDGERSIAVRAAGRRRREGRGNSGQPRATPDRVASREPAGAVMRMERAEKAGRKRAITGTRRRCDASGHQHDVAGQPRDVRAVEAPEQVDHAVDARDRELRLHAVLAERGVSQDHLAGPVAVDLLDHVG